MHLRDSGMAVTELQFSDSGKPGPTIDDYITDRKLEMVFMFSNQLSRRTQSNYAIRRLSTDFNIPLITNVQVAEYFVNGLEELQKDDALENGSLQEYWARDNAADAN